MLINKAIFITATIEKENKFNCKGIEFEIEIRNKVKEKLWIHFELVSEYAPTGDQPQAIDQLVKGFQEGNQCQTLLGVTGSGNDVHNGKRHTTIK